MLRIATSMRERGFRVWVDTEMMSGSTLDAMAAAVEDAYCVLICITERYKASANCRLEGTCESLNTCGNTKGYSSTYLAMGFANVRAGTWYPPEH